MGKFVPISVVIPTMNRPETLERTLSTYAAGEMLPEQIIIVDQTEDENKKHVVQQISRKYGCDYLYLREPSLTAARNIGRQAANYEIIVFSDDDIDVYDDTMKCIFEIMRLQDIALIAGIDDLTGASKTNIGYILGTKSYKKRNIGHVTKSILGRYPDHVTGEIQTEWAMGYFFAVRKSCINKWNLSWDERLISYAYAEDLDYTYRYCKKAKQEGLKCILTDKVHVKHLASKEYRVPSRKSTFMYAIHRRYIADKNHMGSRAAIAWCDFWRIVERVIKHEHPDELISAIRKAAELRRNSYVGMEEAIRKV